tara:strand:+ start:532 stop:843 length:312 start_codon:yes stop_codon:yes gene_type:complete
MTRGLRYENFALNTLQLIELDENIQVRNGVIAILAEKVNCDQAKITGQSLVFADLGLNDLVIDSLIVSIKDRFGVMVLKRDFYTFRTVNDLISFVRDKYRSRP